MNNLGAIAALGVIGPGIGIGILAGLSSTAISRNPDAAAQIRGLAIILAAFAEGLACSPWSSGCWPSSSSRRRAGVPQVAIVDAGQAAQVVRLQAATATGGLTINLFWIIVAALNFLIFFAVLYLIVLKPIGG